MNEPMQNINIEDLDLISAKTASEVLNITPQTLDFYVKKYDIKHKMTEAGRIFLRQDILDFQESRKGRLKHRRKK